MTRQIGAIILAAGESRRMGRPKQLLPWGEQTVIEAVVAAARASLASEVVVVLGHEAERVREAIGPGASDVRFVENPLYREGMLSSVRAGVRALSEHCEAFLLFLGDQPMASPAVARALIGAYEPGGILVPTCGGRRGHPVLFCLSYREEIMRLDDAVGLRQLSWRHPQAVREIPVEAGSIHIDLDTPEDYARHRPVSSRPEE